DRGTDVVPASPGVNPAPGLDADQLDQPRLVVVVGVLAGRVPTHRIGARRVDLQRRPGQRGCDTRLEYPGLGQHHQVSHVHRRKLRKAIGALAGQPWRVDDALDLL